MRNRVAWLAAGAALIGVALYRTLSRTRLRAAAPAPVPDPRADELRRKLAESRAIVDERESFESAETPIDQAEAVRDTVDEKRRRVHERGRSAADEMRRRSEP